MDDIDLILQVLQDALNDRKDELVAKRAVLVAANEDTKDIDKRIATHDKAITKLLNTFNRRDKDQKDKTGDQKIDSTIIPKPPLPAFPLNKTLPIPPLDKLNL